ncbi:MAG: hypothetical protein IJK28_06345 [Clostridia bacterium]|nr:hypothetical protein [Clostridia bacterium]
MKSRRPNRVTALSVKTAAQRRSLEKPEKEIDDRRDDPAFALFLPLELGKFLVRERPGVFPFRHFGSFFHDRVILAGMICHPVHPETGCGNADPLEPAFPL